MFWKRIAYTRIAYIKIAYRLLVALDLGQVGKKVKNVLKFPTDVFYQIKQLFYNSHPSESFALFCLNLFSFVH